MIAVEPDSMEARLIQALAGVVPGLREIRRLRPLSGGAVQETWAFEAAGDAATMPLILRRARGTLRADRAYGIDLATEAKIVQLAHDSGVPAPNVHYVLRPQDGLGDGFIMDFIEGETIPRRILRDSDYSGLRAGLAAECGGVLAAIHKLDPLRAGPLDTRQPRETVACMFQDYVDLEAPSPVFELAFRRLHDTMPADLDKLSLVHGDFRNGNLLVGPDRLRAVLDWEGVHVGDPHEDLGYICIASWRFGELDKPVGGFGSREDLYAAYEKASSTPVDPARAAFWELAFTMNWGIQCAQMAGQFLSGADPSVERGAIGRRRSETELDVLMLLDPEGRHA